ncbi:hypothetical protein C4588_02660 [Candidatus Parcubacteria bacterium]|nr:MAG: hypothetical protein C4588_02660 [Candidatus Parcubacteria bacterium]
MSHKITLTGSVSSDLREIDSIITFDLVTGGSKHPPKGLPSSEGEIKYTIFCNKKQVKKAGLLEGDIKIHKILVQGEPVLNLPENKCPGQIGVVCFKVEMIPEKKETCDTEEKDLPEENMLPLDKIIIPKDFRPPGRAKVEAAIEYYKEHGKFDKPVTVDKRDMLLTDGYKRYVAAQQMGLMEIEVSFTGEETEKIEEIKNIIAEEKTEHQEILSRKGKTMAFPLSDIIIPEQFLKTPPKRIKVEEALEFYRENEKFDKPVVVKEKTMTLTDGYKRYVAAQELGLKEIMVKFT